MTPEQFKSIRVDHLDLSQEELAIVLGLAGKKVISNIEVGLRNPSHLTVALMGLLADMPKKKATELVDLIRTYSLKEKWLSKRGGK